MQEYYHCQYTTREPYLFPQVVMKEDDGDEKSIKEESEEEADEDDNVNI